MDALNIPSSLSVPTPPPLPAYQPVEDKRAHQTWRRVSLSLFGILLLALHWRWAVNHLYSLSALHNDAALVAFTSITQAAFYGIVVIVVFLVTGLTFFSWAQSTSIATNLVGQITDAIKKKQ